MSGAGAKSNDDEVGAYFRDRAMHYRMMATKARIPRLAVLCRELAEAFDKDAKNRERRDDG
jgi:hypothetical protein